MKQDIEVRRVFTDNMTGIHVCAVGVRSNTLRDNYFIPYTLRMLRLWKAIRLRTLVHVDQTPDGIRAQIAKYGVPPTCLPATVGGVWTYERDFNNWISERIEYEKETYWSGESQKVQQVPGNTKREKTDNDTIQREKKRKMDALYARRKRERRRIEIEVLQEQCLEYNNKNSALGKQNKWLEGLLKKPMQSCNFMRKGTLIPATLPHPPIFVAFSCTTTIAQDSVDKVVPCTLDNDTYIAAIFHIIGAIFCCYLVSTVRDVINSLSSRKYKFEIRSHLAHRRSQKQRRRRVLGQRPDTAVPL